MGEAMHEWGQGIYWKSLYLHFKFAVNLKILYKIVLLLFFFKLGLIFCMLWIFQFNFYFFPGNSFLVFFTKVCL